MRHAHWGYVCLNSILVSKDIGCKDVGCRVVKSCKVVRCRVGDWRIVKTVQKRESIETLAEAEFSVSPSGNGLQQSSNGQTSRTRITTVDQETLKARLYFPAEKRQVTTND